MCVVRHVELHGLNAPLLPLPPSQLGGIASAKHRSSLAAFGQISMTSLGADPRWLPPELTSVYDEHETVLLRSRI